MKVLDHFFPFPSLFMMDYLIGCLGLGPTEGTNEPLRDGVVSSKKGMHLHYHLVVRTVLSIH
jgi:hypothetical protein